MIKNVLFLMLAFFAAVEGKEKLNCVLYGNCQVGPVYEYLKKHHKNLYNYYYTVSYLAISGQASFDKEKFQEADLFIYQTVADKYGEMSTKYIINNLLKKSCQLICFPSVGFGGYHPDYTEKPNPKTQFKRLNELLELGFTPDQIVEASKRDDFVPLETTLKVLKFTMDINVEKEKENDIKIVDFIEANWRKHKLFHQPLHPTNYLLKEMLKRTLIYVGLDTDQVETSPVFKKEILDLEICRIYPCVHKQLNLEFPFEDARYDEDIRKLVSPKKKSN